MRGTRTDFVPSRIRGRRSLLRRLRALLLAGVRFGQHRACSPTDRDFSHRLVDGLSSTLAAVERDEVRS